MEPALPEALHIARFDVPPVVPFWRTVVKRRSGAVIPHVEARASALPGDPGAYWAVCGLPPEEVLPVCFPDMLCRGLQLAVLTSPRFPLPLAGIVHARQRIEQVRAIRRGEALAGRVWVEGHRTVRNGGEFDLHTEVSIPGGTDEVVWHGVTTIFSRSLPGDGVKRERPAAPVFEVERTADWTLSSDLGRRYARVSGDVNPIHQYAWTARLFGFERAIIHGWWTLARCAAELQLPPGPVSMEAAFVSPLFLPSTARFRTGRGAEGRLFEVRAGEGLLVAGRVAS